MLYFFGERTLDTARQEFRRGDALIGLERKVFEVLRHLIEHRERLVGKEELLERLWPGVAVEQGAVARCVSAARRAVNDDGRRQRVIRTVHGRGYRFVAAVETQPPHAPASRGEPAVHAEPGAPAGSSPETPSPGFPASSRPATVLCGVRSPPASLALDLDAERTLVERLAGLLGEVVRSYDGAVQHLGSGGFTAIFGAPRAQEDHARRAVLAALAIRRRWPASAGWGGVALGLHTSLAAFVDPGESAPGTPVLAGEAGSRAVELAHEAASGTIVISDAVRRLAGDFFTCAPLGPRAAHGPSARHRVLGKTAARSRFEVARRRGLTPMVGRDAELDMLRRHWDQACRGEGRVVLIAGEPGVGKTRLVHELAERLTGEAALLETLGCSPYHVRSALHPVVRHLRSALGLAIADAPETSLERLQLGLARRGLPPDETLPLFAELLSLPPLSCVPRPASSPRRQQEERAHRALAAWLLAEEVPGPILYVWEDLQWADPSTLDLLGLVLDRAAGRPLLVVCTFRPEFTPRWRPRSYVSSLTLPRLDRPATAAMVGHVAGSRPLAPEILDPLVSRAAGVPLFVEELTRTLAGTGVVRAVGDRDEIAGTLASSEVPATLRDLLLARLDRLDDARDVVEVAAVIGLDFSSALLQAALPVGGEIIERSLRRLVDADVIRPRGPLREGRYVFTHPLLREVAYQSLCASRRHALHAAVAEEIERRVAVREAPSPATAYAEPPPEVAPRGSRPVTGSTAA